MRPGLRFRSCAANMVSATPAFTNGKRSSAEWKCPPLGGASLVCRAMETKRLQALEEENGKLKRMLADAMLDNVALKDLLGNKW